MQMSRDMIVAAANHRRASFPQQKINKREEENGGKMNIQSLTKYLAFLKDTELKYNACWKVLGVVGTSGKMWATRGTCKPADRLRLYAEAKCVCLQLKIVGDRKI